MSDLEHQMTELRAFFKDLLRLNPDYSAHDIYHASDLAASVGDVMFAEATQHVEAIIDAYLASPQKLQGGAVLHEYFGLLEAAERRLLAAAKAEDGSAVGDVREAGGRSTMALVPASDFTPLTRCKAMAQAGIPSLLSKAADAYRQRNVSVDTVVEIAFRLLWKMDPVQAERWCLEYISRHDGALDPDVIRDLLRIALQQDALTRRFLGWVLDWCGDMRLLEHWPMVVYTGDRVLCIHGARAWLGKHPPRNPSLAHLKLLFSQGRIDDETLLRWLEAALSTLADCMMRIMSVSEKLEQASDSDFSMALFSELRRMSGVFPTVMIVGNQLLCLPDGPHQFAQAVFGLAGEELDRWNRQLDDFVAKVIRRVFILDMRASRSPIDTIRRLTFGDDAAFRAAYAQLDLVSERFDSPKQREKVVQILVPFYSSYRRDKILAAEVTRRYRRIMRMLHEDFLAEKLTREQMAAVRADGMVREMASLVGEARRYLDRFRDRTGDLEEVVAARIAFEESTRKRRLGIIRKVLLEP